MRMRIDPPNRVRNQHGLPAGHLVVVGHWGMSGGLVGLWLARPGEELVGVRWPLTAVTVDQVREWEVAS